MSNTIKETISLLDEVVSIIGEERPVEPAFSNDDPEGWWNVLGWEEKASQALADLLMVERRKNQKLEAENAELKKQSKWISVEDELPSGKVLMSFLEPLFGSYYQEVGVGYYDSPDDYENPEDATGWRFWIPDKPVVGKGVTHWMPLPTPPEGD